MQKQLNPVGEDPFEASPDQVASKNMNNVNLV